MIISRRGFLATTTAVAANGLGAGAAARGSEMAPTGTPRVVVVHATGGWLASEFVPHAEPGWLGVGLAAATLSHQRAREATWEALGRVGTESARASPAALSADAAMTLRVFDDSGERFSGAWDPDDDVLGPDQEAALALVQGATSDIWVDVGGFDFHIPPHRNTGRRERSLARWVLRLSPDLGVVVASEFGRDRGSGAHVAETMWFGRGPTARANVTHRASGAVRSALSAAAASVGVDWTESDAAGHLLGAVRGQ